MGKFAEKDYVRVPVSLTDSDGLRELAGVYKGMVDEDVIAVAGDNLPEIIELSQSLADRIETTIGSVATLREVSIGIVDINEDENKILESARRIHPTKTS